MAAVTRQQCKGIHQNYYWCSQLSDSLHELLLKAVLGVQRNAGCQS